jgi:hypothetical protein
MSSVMLIAVADFLRCDKHRHFQCHQRPPRIAVGFRRPQIDRRSSISIASFHIRDPGSAIARRISDDIVLAQRRKLKNLAPAHQRRIHREKRILRRRPTSRINPASTSAAEYPAAPD